MAKNKHMAQHNVDAHDMKRNVVACNLIAFSLSLSLQSNSTPHSELHSEEEDKHSEESHRTSPQEYLDESQSHEVTESFAQQQRELLERLKEQYTSFPFSNHVSTLSGMDLSEQAKQRLQAEAHSNFPFSFPTPPPSKGEDDVKTLSASAKKSSQNNSSWSYEDQFKQVRQVSFKSECLGLRFLIAQFY